MSSQIVRSISDDEQMEIGIHLERAQAIAKLVHDLAQGKWTEVLVPESLRILMESIDSDIKAADVLIMNEKEGES